MAAECMMPARLMRRRRNLSSGKTAQKRESNHGQICSMQVFSSIRSMMAARADRLPFPVICVSSSATRAYQSSKIHFLN